MARTTRACTPLLTALAAAVFLTTGCGPDAKDKKIADLTAENEQLKRELGGRDKQLTDAQMREEDAQRSIEDLNGQLAKMRADGAKTKETDGWISMPGFDMISIPGSVLFDAGKADLRIAGRSTMDKIASDIRARFADRDIYVFGHTDDQPIKKSKWKDNWELAAQRALTVVRSLRTSGIPSESLVSASCGEYRPKTANAGEVGRRQNRRVEFYAVQRKGGAISNASANAGE